MQITAKQIRELANKKQEEAMSHEYKSSEYLRLLRISFEGQRIAQSLDDLKEFLGVSHLSVEINDRP
jgi:glutaredoxin-related protein